MPTADLVPRDINRGERAGVRDASQLVVHADNGEQDEATVRGCGR